MSSALDAAFLLFPIIEPARLGSDRSLPSGQPSQIVFKVMNILGSFLRRSGFSIEYKTQR